jgi:hypothetical protein
MRPYLCACSTLGEVYDGTLFTRDAGMLVVEQYTSQLSDSKVRKEKKKHKPEKKEKPTLLCPARAHTCRGDGRRRPNVAAPPDGASCRFACVPVAAGNVPDGQYLLHCRV